MVALGFLARDEGARGEGARGDPNRAQGLLASASGVVGIAASRAREAALGGTESAVDDGADEAPQLPNLAVNVADVADDGGSVRGNEVIGGNGHEGEREHNGNGDHFQGFDPESTA